MSYKKKYPSIKQLKTMQLVYQGFSVPRAMREAGYSRSTSLQSGKFMKRKIVQETLATMPRELIEVGITKRYIAEKLKDELEATKIHTSHTEPDREVPDHMARLKAIDKWHEFMKEGQQEGQVKRRMTIEEFVNEGVEKRETIQDAETL